jgi:hypothetical protein
MLPMAKLEKFRKRPAIGFSDCMMLEVARKPDIFRSEPSTASSASWKAPKRL